MSVKVDVSQLAETLRDTVASAASQGAHGTVTTDAFPDLRYDGFIKEISPEANRSAMRGGGVVTSRRSLSGSTPASASQ